MNWTFSVEKISSAIYFRTSLIVYLTATEASHTSSFCDVSTVRMHTAAISHDLQLYNMYIKKKSLNTEDHLFQDQKVQTIKLVYENTSNIYS